LISTEQVSVSQMWALQYDTKTPQIFTKDHRIVILVKHCRCIG